MNIQIYVEFSFLYKITSFIQLTTSREALWQQKVDLKTWGVHCCFLMYRCFARMHFCVSCVCMLHMEARQGPQILCNQSYRWLRTITWELGIEAGYSRKQPRFLTAEHFSNPKSIFLVLNCTSIGILVWKLRIKLFFLIMLLFLLLLSRQDYAM